MHIGSVRLDNMTVMAPLAGITNLPLRLLAKEAGCGLVCTEMVSANGLIHRSRKTRQLLDSHPDEKPLSAQIFGSDPDVVGEAARMVAASGADILDINFGCAVKKVVKTGAGVALMRMPAKAEALLRGVRRAVRIPLSIKIRSGWDAGGNEALEIARLAEDCGVDAIAVHPRTAGQGFRGRADWSVIAAVKRAVSIPVIGNGDIWSAEDAHRMLTQTNCDGVMIGRAAIGYPWIFSEVVRGLRGVPVGPPTLGQRQRIMSRYIRASVAYCGEKQACFMMRSRLGWFVKGLPHSSQFREAIKGIACQSEALELVGDYLDRVTRHMARRTEGAP